MNDTLPIEGAPKPVDVEATAREERRLCAELHALGKHAPSEEVGEKWRQWFGTVSELLVAQCLGQQAISPEVAWRLWLITSQLSVGKVDPAIECAAARAGRRPETPLERLDKQAAVDYIAFVRAAGILASDPVDDIAKAYDVAKRTVQSWVHDIPPHPNINNADPECVIERAAEGARRFRPGGRSQASIWSRDPRRNKPR